MAAKRTSISVAIYEYTPFCNGRGDVKFPSDRHAAELTLLSVVGAEAVEIIGKLSAVLGVELTELPKLPPKRRARGR